MTQLPTLGVVSPLYIYIYVYIYIVCMYICMKPLRDRDFFFSEDDDNFNLYTKHLYILSKSYSQSIKTFCV